MNENVNVCITPKGDKPVLHFSQFDNERVFTVTVLADDGESAVDLTDLDIEFRLRKTDSHVVTIAPISVVSNVITFLTTEQLCACCGQNIASVVIMNNDSVISTLDILVDIQRDILSGGLTSESDIRNLTTQIETIIPEVLADDYYTKTEVDDLIADIPTFDPTNYYDKSDVDGLLADKADVSDLPDMSNYYTKSETDTALSTKADAASTYNMTQVNNLLNLRLPIPQEQEVQNLPASVVTLSNAGEDAPLSELTVAVASGFSGANITRCGVNFAEVDNDDNPQKSYYTYSTETPEKIYGTKNHASNMMFYVFKAYFVSGKTYLFHFDKYQINGTDSNCRVYLYSDTVFGTSLDSFDVISSGYSWTSTYTGYALVGIYGIGGNNATFELDEFMIELGSTATTYEPYNGTTTAISFGQTLTQSGVLDCISGVLTLADESTIQCQGVEIDTLLHDNNIYSDTGDILSMKYIIAGSEDVFKYIRMIKG